METCTAAGDAPLEIAAAKRYRGQRGPGKKLDPVWMTGSDAVAAGIPRSRLAYLRDHRLIGFRQLPGGLAYYAREDVERLLRESTYLAIGQGGNS